MRWITSEEKLILGTCFSEGLILKAALCLIFDRDGGPVDRYPRQLVGTGLYRERQVMDAEENLFTICEEQVMICGVGILNWWAKTVWAPCKPRSHSYSRVDRELLEKIREERGVHSAGERPAGKLCLEGRGLGVLPQGQ